MWSFLFSGHSLHITENKSNLHVLFLLLKIFRQYWWDWGDAGGQKCDHFMGLSQWGWKVAHPPPSREKVQEKPCRDQLCTDLRGRITWLLALQGVTLVQQHSQFPGKQSGRALNFHTDTQLHKKWKFCSLPQAVPENQEFLQGHSI